MTDTVCGWPGVILAGARLRAGIVPYPGGRVLSLAHDGEELLFVATEYCGSEIVDISGDLRSRKAELGFRLWGGNKTWLAPEESWLAAQPPLDLDCGVYEVHRDAGAVVLSSPVCRETGLRVRRRISLVGGALVIEHALENPGSTPITRGIWSVTQWLRPFDVYFRGEARPYREHGTTDAVMASHVRRVAGWTAVSARDPVQFKVGARVDRPEIVALRPGDRETLVVRTTFDTDLTAEFAHDATVEVFNAAALDYLEIEAHRALEAILPGQEVRFVERISVERRPGRVGIADLVADL
jgi:hypothetical protein